MVSLLARWRLGAGHAVATPARAARAAGRALLDELRLTKRFAALELELTVVEVPPEVLTERRGPGRSVDTAGTLAQDLSQKARDGPAVCPTRRACATSSTSTALRSPAEP